MYRVLRMIFYVILIFLCGVIVFLFWASERSLSASCYPVIEDTGLPSGKEKPEFLTVMTYNIGYGSGMKNNMGSILSEKEIYENLDKIIECVKKNSVDILALQEVDFHSKRSCYINQMEYLAKKLKFKYIAYIVNWDKNYVPYPYTLSFKKHFGRIQSGQVVLSRYPIKSHKYYFFEKPRKNIIYNMFYIDRAVQILKIDVPGFKEIGFLNVHLEAYCTETRVKQVKKLIEIVQKLEFDSIILAGDFNSLPPYSVKKKGFSDEPEVDYTDDNSIDLLLKTGTFKEVICEEFNKKKITENKTWTFPSNAPSRRLDYIFFTDDLKVKQGYVDLNAGTGSDHLPVVCKLER